MKKVLGIIAIVGLGALLYYQYKKMKKKNEENGAGAVGKSTVINRPNYAAAMEKGLDKSKIKTALKGKFADIKQQNQ